MVASYDPPVSNEWRAACGVLLFVVLLAGCRGPNEVRKSGAPLCSPRSVKPPCTEALLETDYRVRLWTHCGVHTAYVDGRWWRIDPPQPEGANWTAGTARLLARNQLVFKADDGRRYAFAPAPPAFEPPLCF